jgi:hypothetical protein
VDEIPDSACCCCSQSFSLLSQYRFFAGGIGLGAAYAMRYKKGVAPMIVAGLGGSMADIVYGYMVACQDHVQRKAAPDEPTK